MGDWSLTRLRNGAVKRVARGVLPRVLRQNANGHRLVTVGSGEDARKLPVDLLPPGAICYLVGVGDSISLDLELAERGCAVHAFDPTPKSIDYVERLRTPASFSFHPVGVWTENTTLKFYAPAGTSANWSVLDLHETGDYFTAECRSLRTLMTEQGHDQLDLLKLDIEGAWEPVLDSMLDEGITPTVLAVEFDSPTSIRKVRRMVNRLSRAGLELAHFDREDYVFVRAGAHPTPGSG